MCTDGYLRCFFLGIYIYIYMLIYILYVCVCVCIYDTTSQGNQRRSPRPSDAHQKTAALGSVFTHLSQPCRARVHGAGRAPHSSSPN